MGDARRMEQQRPAGHPCRRYPAELVAVCPVIQPSDQSFNVQGHESTPTTFSLAGPETTHTRSEDMGVSQIWAVPPGISCSALASGVGQPSNLTVRDSELATWLITPMRRSTGNTWRGS